MSVWQTYYRINEGTLMNIKKILAHVLMLMMMVNMAQGMNLIDKPGTDCSICADDEKCTVSSCCPNDVICLGCRIRSIDAQLDNKEIPHCPVRGCTQEIGQRTIQDILKDDHALFDRYDTFLIEKWKRENGIKPCPTPNCEAEFDSKSGRGPYQCYACGKSYCTACEYDHRGVTCEDAAAVERKCPDCDKIHARNMTCDAAAQDNKNNDGAALRDKNCQRCPECKVLVYKEGGCNYMTCGQCRYTFCWICLGPSRNHVCLNNNCNIWEADHATVAAQRDALAAQIAVLRKMAFVLAGASAVAFVAYATVYQTWNQKRKLNLIAQTADTMVEKMLAIEFELFDENNSLLTLQEQFDIDSLLKIIKSTQKRHAFKYAVEAYDVSLKAAYDAISSAKYYHQTPEYFITHEPQLVEKLNTDLDALKQVISSCQAEIRLNWKKLVGLSGLLACAAVGTQWYYFDN